MKFEKTLKKAKFIKRYKRFFADIEFDGEVVVAHVPNTGSMKTCLEDGAPCLVSQTDDPKRKLKFTLQMIKTKSSWVGVNTHLPNKIVREAYDEKLIPSWKKYKYARNEVKLNDKTRIDMVLGKNSILVEAKKISNIDELNATGDKFHFVEVKNVSYVLNKKAMFPDSVSTRAQKHLQEMMDLIDMGHTCEIVFTIQRNDCTSFSAAKEIDPKYAELLLKAKEKGVKISPYICSLNNKSLSLGPIHKIPFKKS